MAEFDLREVRERQRTWYAGVSEPEATLDADLAAACDEIERLRARLAATIQERNQLWGQAGDYRARIERLEAALREAMSHIDFWLHADTRDMPEKSLPELRAMVQAALAAEPTTDDQMGGEE